MRREQEPGMIRTSRVTNGSSPLGVGKSSSQPYTYEVALGADLLGGSGDNPSRPSGPGSAPAEVRRYHTCLASIPRRHLAYRLTDTLAAAFGAGVGASRQSQGQQVSAELVQRQG